MSRTGETVATIALSTDVSGSLKDFGRMVVAWRSDVLYALDGCFYPDAPGCREYARTLAS
jgi:hypothetical protein